MIFDTKEDALATLRVSKRLDVAPTSFKWGPNDPSDKWHRVLLADGESYCGFDCDGRCGLPRLVRLMRADEGCAQGVFIEQASALLGCEPVWSSSRWEGNQPWEGEVVLAPYDERSNKVWG